MRTRNVGRNRLMPSLRPVAVVADAVHRVDSAPSGLAEDDRVDAIPRADHGVDDRGLTELAAAASSS